MFSFSRQIYLINDVNSDVIHDSFKLFFFATNKMNKKDIQVALIAIHIFNTQPTVSICTIQETYNKCV